MRNYVDLIVMSVNYSSLLTWLVLFCYVSMNIVVMSLSWSALELWVMMEIITFIFVVSALLDCVRYSNSTQGLVSYFLVQSGLSMMLLLLILLHVTYSTELWNLILLTLFSKLGILPFGFWVFPTFTQLNLKPLFNVMVWQKVPPLMILHSFVSISSFLLAVILFNILVASAVAFSSSNVISLLVFSSVANNSWFVVALLMELYHSFVVLFVVYSLGVLLALSSTGSLSRVGLVSLSGLPPFPLFFAKLGVISLFIVCFDHMSALVLGSLFLVSSILLSASYVRFLFTNSVLKSTYMV